MLFSGPLLNLALNIPACCSRLPADAEQVLLRDAGVSAIITDDTNTFTVAQLPVLLCSADAEFLEVDGSSWLWLRGRDRASLLDRAQAIPRKGGFIASLPSGAAASESALRRSTILVWQLASTYGCSAVVLSWPELEAAAGGGGAASATADWGAIASQLTRMRQPSWTAIQGG